MNPFKTVNISAFCGAINCHNSKLKQPQLSFHRFPQDVAMYVCVPLPVHVPCMSGRMFTLCLVSGVVNIRPDSFFIAYICQVLIFVVKCSHSMGICSIIPCCIR